MEHTPLDIELSNLIVKSSDFARLSERLDVYCPFEALSVERTEIRHSNFLANVVNPRGQHGFDDTCTRALLETLVTASGEPKLLLQLHLRDLGEIEVLREWRNIDLLLRLPGLQPSDDLVFAIELKVEARESAGQLKRYATTVRETWPQAKHLFYFMTLRDDDASDPDWISINFSSLVRNLESANNNQSGDPKARMMLESYTQMIRRKYLEDPALEDLAEKIWAKHKNALEFLTDRRPNPARELAKLLSEEVTLKSINEGLETSNAGLTVAIDSANARFIRLAVTEWDRFQSMQSGSGWTPSNRILLCEIEVSERTLAVRMVIGRGDQQERQKVFTALKEGNALPSQVRPLSPEFSRIVSKSLRNRPQMEKMLEQGIEEADLAKMRDDIASFYSKTLRGFDDALKGLEEV
ncbi:PD-(D/E)XK nuclease family protein [Shimia sagamensis]|uniref:PD-(D/E)XK nuclease superfamily protein n=1 Tax=Shimia sagamensis TaxID=1566352 RepID=A0ABY1P7K2_9RHOB|nr:PD-(D/E)XK nuclease family protein [Shimia sagamensis]SMP28203.1 PD-(D/E)XK nuclease superfamily protein [Shimia sagamensis]